MQKLPYKNRTDLQKIQSQWNKITGHLSRKDWSAAIVRAATACEIAANLVIRRKFAEKSTFSPAFVDHILKWANGMRGKFQYLIIPMCTADNEEMGKVMKAISSKANKINDKRNAIVHGGDFAGEPEARKVVQEARKLIEELVGFYEVEFKLMDATREVVVDEAGDVVHNFG